MSVGCSQWNPGGPKWSQGGFINVEILSLRRKKLDLDPYSSEKLDLDLDLHSSDADPKPWVRPTVAWVRFPLMEVPCFAKVW
jgi:hypothetical protein